MPVVTTPFVQPVLPVVTVLDPIPRIIPAYGISLLAGAPNVGKTALLAGMARRFRDGQLIFGHQPSPIPLIGVINADRSWSRGTGEWFKRAGFPEVRFTDGRRPQLTRARSAKLNARSACRVRRQLKLPESLLLVDPVSCSRRQPARLRQLRGGVP